MLSSATDRVIAAVEGDVALLYDHVDVTGGIEV